MLSDLQECGSSWKCVGEFECYLWSHDAAVSGKPRLMRVAEGDSKLRYAL